MTTKTLIFLATIGVLFINVKGATQCYGVDCPGYTESCKKEMKTSSDKLTILTTISCLDESGSSLLDHFRSAPNTLGRNTNYKSTSFAGTVNNDVSSRYLYPNTFNRYNHGNQIEDFK